MSTTQAHAADISALVEHVNRLDFTYNDTSHVYTFDGRRCRSVTNIAKILTDDYTLNQWRLRQAGLGLAENPELVEDIAAHADNSGRVNDIMQRAIEAAGADRGARRGTQAHSATERADLDQPLITDQQQRDAAVWERTLDAYGIEVDPTLIEFVVLYPNDHIAGRVDRYVRLNGHLVDLDIKTGSSATRYPHGTCIQLALHVNAPLIQAERRMTHDGIEVTTRWRPQPHDLRTDVAYVLSMPTREDADLGTLYEFQLDGKHAGNVGVRAAIWARHFQMNDGLARPIPRPLKPAPQLPPGETAPTEPESAGNTDSGSVTDMEHHRRLGDLRARIDMLSDATKTLVRNGWNDLPSLRGAFTPDQLERAIALVDTHDEFTAQASIEESVAAHPSNTREPFVPWEPTEGAPMELEATLALSKLYAELPSSISDRVNERATEAQRVGLAFRGSSQMTERRYWLLQTVLHLAANDAADDSIRYIVATAVGESWPHDDRITPGAALGLVHHDQAERVHDIALEYLSGALVIDGDALAAKPNTEEK